MRRRPLVLVGAGGFARETAEAVRAVNTANDIWDLIGYFDDDPGMAGAVCSGLPVLGPIDRVQEYPWASLIICTGRPDSYSSRREIALRLELPEYRFATVLHPTASVGTTSTVGPGSVILGHVDLTADVVVGRHVAVMPQTVLTHDVRVGDWATLASGVRLGGGVNVGEGAYVGSGASVREGITIGARSMIGMGAVVTRDVPPDRLWFGSPARDVSAAPSPVRTEP